MAIDPEEDLQVRYGRIVPLDPAAVAELLAGAGVRWWIAGGRAARVGAPPRHHEDTDVAVDLDDLPALRRHLAGWHLWEAHDGALRPLRAADTLTPGVGGIWVRRDVDHPWTLDLLLHPHAEQWIFKHDHRIRLPWDRRCTPSAASAICGPRSLCSTRPTMTARRTAPTGRPQCSTPRPVRGWPSPSNCSATTSRPGPSSQHTEPTPTPHPASEAQQSQTTIGCLAVAGPRAESSDT